MFGRWNLKHQLSVLYLVLISTKMFHMHIFVDKKNVEMKNSGDGWINNSNNHNKILPEGSFLPKFDTRKSFFIFMLRYEIISN